MLTLDIVHDFSKTALGKLDEIDASSIREVFSSLAADAAETLDREGVPRKAQQLLYAIDMRYENQEHTLSIPLGVAAVQDDSVDRLRDQFAERHLSSYGYVVSDPIVVVTYRVRAVGGLEKPTTASSSSSQSIPSSPHEKARRSVRHRESGGILDCAIYDRDALEVGCVVRGPAIVEEPTSTTLLAPAQELFVDTFGNLVITNPDAPPTHNEVSA
jgi:N-methylhydantoinase A